MKSDRYLDEFVEAQRTVMREHDDLKGSTWLSTPDHVLVDNLFEEIREFENKNDPERELLDIANSCYILWTKRKLKHGR